MKPLPDLTPEEIELAERTRGSGARGKLPLDQVAKVTGIRLCRLQAHFIPGFRERRSELEKLRQSTRKKLGEFRSKPLDVPLAVLDERDRVMLAPMDPLAALLGDPPPGRSALDKKRQTQAA